MNKDLGQVFTPKSIVKKMIKLISIKEPSILEPSSGDGAFYMELKKTYDTKSIIAIEMDEKVAHKGAKISDFFDYNPRKKFDVIIGNPPYVDFKKIPSNTIDKIDTNLVHKPNLYMFFLEKSMKMTSKNGELIFIIPTEWLVAASAKSLIMEIYFNWSIQHFEIIEENVWDGASVTTAIVKLKKGNHKKINYYISSNSKIFFGERPKIKFKCRATIKVGAASGNNSIYKSSDGTDDFIDSTTERTNLLVKYLYTGREKEWIRKLPIPPRFTYQIFVNSKTRTISPFWMYKQKKSQLLKYDASVLSIFIDGSLNDAKDIMDQLNKLKWEEMGIKKNGKYNFTQSILEGVING